MSLLPAQVKSKQRCPSPPAPLQPEIQLMIRNFADALMERHGDLFTGDPRLKSRIAAELRRLLPPQAGRPGLASVTVAIQLHREIERSHPERSAKEIWAEIYARVIPNWETLSVVQRREEADQLHRQVRWRIGARRKRCGESRRGSREPGTAL